MMTTIAYIAAGLIVAYLLIRFVFPKQFFAWLLRIFRSLCGLRSQSINVDGVNWHYLVGGPADGDVLLLIHGFGGDKDNWPIYARYFTRSYRIIVPDLPGFGESSREADANYTIAAQTPRLHAFARALNIDSMHIAGNSMGGALALEYALTYPDHVQTLTLFNSAGVAGENKSELQLKAEQGECPLTVSSPKEFDELIRFIFYRPMPIPGVIKRVLCEQAIERRAFLDRVFWSLFAEFEDGPLNDQLQALRAPTLIVWGRHDRVIDVSCTDVLAERIPDNRCIVFEKTGHVSMIERHAEAAAAHRKLMGRPAVA